MESKMSLKRWLLNTQHAVGVCHHGNHDALKTGPRGPGTLLWPHPSFVTKVKLVGFPELSFLLQNMQVETSYFQVMKSEQEIRA